MGRTATVPESQARTPRHAAPGQFRCRPDAARTRAIVASDHDVGPPPATSREGVSRQITMRSISSTVTVSAVRS